MISQYKCVGHYLDLGTTTETDRIEHIDWTGTIPEWDPSSGHPDPLSVQNEGMSFRDVLSHKGLKFNEFLYFESQSEWRAKRRSTFWISFIL